MSPAKKMPPFSYEFDLESTVRNSDLSRKKGNFDQVWSAIENNKEADRKSFFRSFRILKPAGIFAGAVLALALAVFTGSSVFNSIKQAQVVERKAMLVTAAAGKTGVKHLSQKQWAVLKAGMIVIPGDEITTGEASYCTLQLFSKAVIRLTPSGSLKMRELKGGSWSFILEKGTLLSRPLPLKQRESFEIQTPTSDISVVGTYFATIVDAIGSTKVEVMDGNVSLRPLPAQENQSVGSRISAGALDKIKNGLSQTTYIRRGEAGTITVSEYSRYTNLVQEIMKQAAEQTSAVEADKIMENSKGKLFSIIEKGNLNGSYPSQNELDSQLITNHADLEKQMKTELPFGSGAQNSTAASNPSSAGGRKPVSGDIVWEREALGLNGMNEPLVFEDKIYITLADQLYIYQTNGALIKALPAAGKNCSLTRPVVQSQALFLGSANGGLFAFDQNGAKIWENRAVGIMKYEANPVAVDGYVIVPTVDKGIQLLNEKGKLIMTIPSDEAVYASPLYLSKNRILVFATENGVLSAYDMTERKPLWSKSITAFRMLFPVYGNEQTGVLFIRDNGKLTGFDPKTGNELYHFILEDMKKTLFAPVQAGSMLMIANNNGAAAAAEIYSIENGKKMNRIDLAQNIVDYDIFGSNIYFALQDGSLENYSLATGALLWKSPQSYGKIEKMALDGDSIYLFEDNKILRIVR